MSERSAQDRPGGGTPVRERGPSAPAPKAPRAGKVSERERSAPTTQLRLLQAEQPRPLRARKTSPRARRPVHWEGQWRLDAKTRRVGQKGVASAREALARAHHDELRRAS
jgi:hypothetical protein